MRELKTAAQAGRLIWKKSVSPALLIADRTADAEMYFPATFANFQTVTLFRREQCVHQPDICYNTSAVDKAGQGQA